jgi:hypothetical protein
MKAWEAPMMKSLIPQAARPVPQTVANASSDNHFRRVAVGCVVVMLLAGGTAAAQVITLDTSGKGPVATNGAVWVDRRFAQIQPTHVALPKSVLDAKTRQELIRLLQAEQGFAMRPFPRGHKGLTLVANGKLEPAGEAYLNMITSAGTSAKPGDRVQLTDVKIEHSKIIFDINGGPDSKHRWLRHVQIGAGPNMNPVMQGDDQEPVGARLTLSFDEHVPALTGADVKALLAPLISFAMKLPIEAFTDTLPPVLKDAILNHHVLVGMSTDMVMFAKGQPVTKTREMDGQMPFEEWIYGRPPQEVDFVRINGNRVIRVEVAKMGETPVIFTKNEVEGLMRTDGTALNPNGEPNVRKVEVGDVQRDPDKQEAAAPPSLRKPGESLPDDKNTGVMKPVRFPKPKATPQPGANPDGEQEAQPSTVQPPAAEPSKPDAAKPPSPAGASQPN